MSSSVTDSAFEASIAEHVTLAPFTTLGIGGPARYFAEATSTTDLLNGIEWARQRDLPLFGVGGGSYVVVSDEGVRGLVLRVQLRGIETRADGDRVIVEARAGEDWDSLVSFCVNRGLAGIECLSGIPGLVGGTPVQNVGAYGQEVSETIVAVRVYDRQAKRIVELSNADCDFSYRASIFNTSARDRYIVLAVSYALT